MLCFMFGCDKDGFCCGKEGFCCDKDKLGCSAHSDSLPCLLISMQIIRQVYTAAFCNV